MEKQLTPAEILPIYQLSQAFIGVCDEITKLTRLKDEMIDLCLVNGPAGCKGVTIYKNLEGHAKPAVTILAGFSDVLGYDWENFRISAINKLDTEIAIKRAELLSIKSELQRF